MEEKNHYNCVYMVDAEKWKRFVEVQAFFTAYADHSYGTVSDVATPPTTVDASFTVEVDSVDFYNEFLRQFVDMIAKVDSISFRNSGNDSVLIDVCVKNMWEVVDSHE